MPGHGAANLVDPVGGGEDEDAPASRSAEGFAAERAGGSGLCYDHVDQRRGDRGVQRSLRLPLSGD